jgi:heme A synthase
MVLVHFPIAGTVIALALLVWARYSRNAAVRKLANVVLILVAWSAFPAAITGGPS